MGRRTAALLALLVVAITIGTSGAAAAHANYARSDPAPNAELASAPARVLVGFSEKYAPASSGLTLLDQSGHEVASGGRPTSDPTELELPLPPIPGGIYTVAWHTVSAEDGDAAKGYFAFRVGGVPSASAPPVTQTRTQGDVTVSLALSPAVPGKNGYLVTVTRGNSPLPTVTRVRLRVTPLDRDIGQSEIVLAAASQPGQYGGSGYELPFAGRYRTEVQVRRSDTLDDLAFGFDIAVAIPTSSPSPTAAPSLAAASPSLAAPASAAPASGPSAAQPAVAPLASVLGALAVLVLVLGVLAARRLR